MASNAPLNLFALIIGINEYKDKSLDALEDLQCAVSDATSISHFLTNSLHVSPSHIHILLDSEATRDNIISFFETHLTHNNDIKTGDPILVYFAGHGTQYLLREKDRARWDTDDGCYEAICPHDRGTVGKDGKKVRDIRDVTLGKMLFELAQSKGNNIAVIFDCCHSGSGTRGARREVIKADVDSEAQHVILRPRFAPPLKDPDVLEDMREETLSTTIQHQINLGTTSLRGLASNAFRHPSLQTHILLSACRQDEVAYEGNNNSGLFTNALLSALHAHRSELHTLSYADLFANLQKYIPSVQHPQCEGRNSHWALFNGKAIGVNKSLVSVVLWGMSGVAGQTVFRVEAGEAHGVLVGTEFAVWPDKLDRGEDISSSLGRLVAKQVFATYCLATSLDSAEQMVAAASASLNHNLFAGVTYWANYPSPVTISFDPSTEHSSRQRELMNKIQRLVGGKSREGLEFVLDPTSPSRDSTWPVISVTDATFTVHRSPRDMPSRTNNWPCKRASDAVDALNRISRFEYHLARTNFSHPFFHTPAHPISSSESTSLIKVQLLRRAYGFVPPNTADVLSTSPTEGLHAVLPAEDFEYVFRLHNNSPVDLFVAMYYFDPSLYTVTQMYTPPATLPPRPSPAFDAPSSKKTRTDKSRSDSTMTEGGDDGVQVMAPLKAGRTLTIGDQTSGVEPFVFTVNEETGETEDVGFVKIWVAEEWLGMGMVEEGEGWEEDLMAGAVQREAGNREWFHGSAPKEERKMNEEDENRKKTWDCTTVKITVRADL